jgi:hypothetical protein
VMPGRWAARRPSGRQELRATANHSRNGLSDPS